MDFSLSDEQQMLKDGVDRFVRENYDPEARRKLIRTEDGYSKEHWQQMAELGWLAVPFAEEDGGLGWGPIEVGIIMESFGRGLVVEPYLSTVVLGGGAVAKAGSPEQRAEILGGVIGGETQLAFAYAEHQARWDLFDVATKAEKAGDAYKVTGQKGVVLGAPSADKLIVTARTAGDRRDKDGLSLFVVDANADGVSLRSYATNDGFRAAEVSLEGAEGQLLGEEGKAWPVIEAVSHDAIVALCNEAVGAMEQSKELTNEYIKTRKQFGVPIGKFQVLQHRMVDIFMYTEEARSMAMMAMIKLAEGADDAAQAVAAAKVQIGVSGRYVSQQSVQLHGGMGVTDEMFISHLFKRLTAINLLFGSADHWLGAYADTYVTAA
jgi:alkylation response protein AidB-like acyl-CoA dehydrogenase